MRSPAGWRIVRPRVRAVGGWVTFYTGVPSVSLVAFARPALEDTRLGRHPASDDTRLDGHLKARPPH
ncbi:MAG: hypothetical protein QOE89_3368 [Pseudonocardiales bacterium]|nr:hypothetical protein [Pseudonocardiales bacterium]